MDFHFPFFIIFLIFCIFFFGWGSLCCCFDLFLSFRFSLFKFLSWGILRRLKLAFWGQFYCISYSIDWGWIYSDFLPYAMCVFPWVSDKSLSILGPCIQLQWVVQSLPGQSIFLSWLWGLDSWTIFLCIERRVDSISDWTGRKVQRKLISINE